MDHNHKHHRVTIAISFFFILINLPQPHCKEDNKYTICSRPYTGGELRDISYPFWGIDTLNRPEYCGGGRPFKLDCFYNTPSIQIGSQHFLVHNISMINYTMTIEREDLHDYEHQEVPISRYCSPNLTNNSLEDQTIFHYTKNVHNITLFFNCPSGVSINNARSFPCPAATNGEEKAFYMDEEDLPKVLPQLKDCNRSIQVQSLHRVPLDTGGGIDALNDAVSTGFEVMYTVADNEQCIQCVESKGACGVNLTDHQFTCYRPSKSNQWNWKRKAIIGLTSATSIGLLIGITIFYSIWKPSTWRGKFWLMTKSNQDIEAILKSYGALTLKRYKFSDVKKMTDNLKVKLGQGGFGAVYKGKLPSNSQVAVKILNSSKENGEEFINEVASISRTSHVNIVTLLGFCLEGRKKALIYEFMPNGSLDKFIYKKGQETIASLSLESLYQIAIGIARGLENLHRGCNTRILHFDIKPHNILLDENFCPKISDFGLAKLCPKNKSIVSMFDPRGTYGYLAPEMWNRRFGGVSHKSDVYSYGMNLLDMVEGRKNTSVEASRSSETYFPDWIYNQLQQSNLRPDGVTTIEENEIVRRMTIVALWCIQTCPNDRPTMSKVIDMLEDSQNSLEIPPNPIHSSPTS